MKYWIELPDKLDHLVDEYNQMTADYDNLSPEECYRYDNLSAELLSLVILHPMQDTTVIAWLPINGTILPAKGQRCLLTNGSETTTGYYERSLGQWLLRDILSAKATHWYPCDNNSSVRSEPGYYESTQPYLY